MNKTKASLSLDLDDLWTYLKTHGNADWQNYPSYLSYAVPRILDFLDQRHKKITFFLVAQDAAFDSNKEVLREIANRGHEIASHTFHHDPWLHIYSESSIDTELALAEEHIFKVTGIHPTGFRGPGFSFSKTVLKVLINRGYSYDASTFPNILNPLARMYFLWSSDLSKEERQKRKGLFGSWKDGLRPNKPYEWNNEGSSLLEIPVTTMPLFKIPIHASYLLYLSSYSVNLAKAYFRFALGMCKLWGVEPSILLHPLDFIGCDDTTALSFFPAMKMESKAKIEVMSEVFQYLDSKYDLVTMNEHAKHIQAGHQLKSRILQDNG